MPTTSLTHPFKNTFLSGFVFTPTTIPFTDEEIVKHDQELAYFEQVFLNPDIEKSLISKNELLASFAISKAEFSTLTLKEAQDVYDLILSHRGYDFIREKLKKNKKLTQKDYDKLEFFNIAKAFRALNQQPFTFADLSAERIAKLHQDLAQGLDIFKTYLSDFTVYKSGNWRDNNTIRVGDYIPAPHTEIKQGVQELVDWLKKNQTVTGVAIFHTALYGLHPFNNGNKRVCRILEHILLRQVGINKKNLYSTSYYYHKEKVRYYKYLLYSLERKNLNHFVSFIQEAIMLSMVSVVKTSLEAKRNDYINAQTTDQTIRQILKPLIKRKELQFKGLFRHIRGKMARQTFVTYLQRAVDKGIITRKEAGRATYYRLNTTLPEEETITAWIAVIKQKLSHIPTEFMLL